MLLDLNDIAHGDLEAALRHYEEEGYLLLEGLERDLTPRFREHVRRALDVDATELASLLETHAAPIELAPDVRARLARVVPDEGLRAAALSALEPLLSRMIGNFLHVNSSFHAQFKGGSRAPSVDHGGYREGSPEVQGGYLLHQDFTGATLATSPSAVTFWVPVNSCDDWTLRLYPRSHRRGLLCNRWLPLDDPHLEPLGEPLDIPARPGRAVLFHALLLHGSSNPGPTRRVSCDLRFFPLCAFLPSQVHTLGDRPLDQHRSSLAAAGSDHARAPFRESLLGMGFPHTECDTPERSAGVWADHLASLFAADQQAARAHFERFVDESFGVDGPTAYERFFSPPQQARPLRDLRAHLAARAASADDLATLDARLRCIEQSPPTGASR